MRYFSKYISAALTLIMAVACNTKEIDNPDNPDKPQISDNIKIAASIKQTRVSYSVDNDNDNDELVPDWEAGDVIFGYYGTGDGRIVFTVTGVDETTGIASLEATSESDWGDFLAEYKTAGKDLKVGLIYTGTKETDKTNLFANGNSVSVAMTLQTGENIPACMHATSFDPDKDDEGQIIRFLFDNDCAIFEIESLTGIAEDAGLGENETLKLKSLTVTNLIPTYEYSYASGALSYNSGTGDPTSYTINLPENTENTWQVDYEGNINRSADKNLLIAVAPNSSKNDILITATVEDGREFSYLYYGNLDAGECYRIKKRDVVAKTSDNQYFTSVKAAFDHAATLVSTFGENNKVTLVNELIYGLRDNSLETNAEYLPAKITINYPVILDLNGCTLSLDCLEDDTDDDTYLTPFKSYYGGGFEVETNGTLRIIDEEECGCIDSCTECPIITNSGIVNIVGGSLAHWTGYQVVINKATGELNVSGGSISSDYGDPYPAIDNFSQDLTISGGEIDGYFAIRNNEGAKANITGGSLNSDDDSAVVNYGELTVGDPDADEEDREYIEIKSSTYNFDCPAIYNSSSNGSFKIYYGNIIGVVGAVEIKGGLQGNIYGGYFESSNDETVKILDGSHCTISGGIFYNSDETAVVGCRSQNTDKKSVLIITWPTSKINGMSIQKYGESIQQPIFYSSSSNNGQVVPVTTSTTGLSYTNTALVYIQGGFLLTHESRFGQFYNDGKRDNDSISNLIVAESGQFYANSNVIGTNNGNDHKDASTVTSFTISDSITIDLPFVPEFFDEYFDEEEFEEGFPKETVLYYFEKK